MSGNRQLVPDSWRQLYNPDRYTGTEWVTSFDLQLRPNADGSLTATARYPGRYKIAAVQGGQQYTAAVVVKPVQPLFKMKGLDFGGFTGLNRAYASNVIAIASHIGADWVHIAESMCMDLNTPGVYQYTDQPSSWCTTATPFSDLAWVIDELHSKGFKVVLEPSAYGYYQGFFEEIQTFLPGVHPGYPVIPVSQVTTFFEAWGRMALDVATLAAQHHVEIYVVGSHDTSVDVSGVGSAVVDAMNAAWKGLIQNIRGIYKGQVWWGPIGPCGFAVPFPFTNYSLLDGIWFSGLVISASTPPCDPNQWDGDKIKERGINNIHAEQMLDYLRALRLTAPGFQYGQKYGLPILWTDFLPDPIDGMNYLGGHYSSTVPVPQSGGTGGAAAAGGAKPSLTRDYQEGLDFLDAVLQAGVIEGGIQIAFPGTVDLFGTAFNDIMARPAVLASLTNWYGGDSSYFAPCMTQLPSNVLFQLLPATCPVALQVSGISLTNLNMVSDSTSAVNPYFEGSSESTAALGDPSWTDYDVKVAVRLKTSLSVIDLSFRLGGSPGGKDYSVHMGQGVALLLKAVYGSANELTHPELAQAALPGKFDPAHWYQVEIQAVGNSIVVKVDGSQLIAYTDNSSPYLAGSLVVHIPGGISTAAFGNLVVTSITGPSLVNAASFAPGVISPGEIVTLFGSQLGPPALVTADSSKTFPLSLAGTRVLFNGIPAPLIYTQATQVSAIVPWQLIGSATAAVVVQYQGASTTPVTASIADSSTALFTALGGGFGQGAILNHDYSVNSPSNPAKAGSVILLYGTGGGALQGSAVDGELATGAAPLKASVSVLVGGQPAQVLYAGAAPGLVNGVVQINVQLPTGVTGGAVPVLATVGQYISQSGVTVAIQ